ncbi:unnamed protein product [Caenorhabditis bovis]|uniref:6-phosphofructokinase n=1 Tax=Caenorhabditis bovis TaxID=2654633 RepID=A0A8S1EJJ4_9PELO|nr:unnamed protein product [Caenorhabditis bovis]
MENNNLKENNKQDMVDDNLTPPVSPIGSRRYGNKKMSVGVITSGGDSQGMNSAIRAVVREVLRRGCACYLIREGFSGLISGNIDIASWATVANVTNLGGTMIGTSRCHEFRTYEGRKTAAKQMFLRKMFHLVVIGGDGSLTGAQILKEEWGKIGEELYADGSITEEVANAGRELQIVGIVGSIDNDCMETDKSIGSDTALHRIVECIDGLVMTAQSHQRIFVVEVMGRYCGYLALTAALAVEADYVFYPEQPPTENWPEKLCNRLEAVRKEGKRQNIVILSEGVTNVKGQKLEAKQVKNEIETRLNVEVRIATLGHLQRGGVPSFLDRLLGLRMGYEAVREVLKSGPDGKSTGSHNTARIMCLKGHCMANQDMVKTLRKTQCATDEARHRNFDIAMKLRGHGFTQKSNIMQYVAQPLKEPVDTNSKVFAIIHVGSPCAGMNAATFAFTRIANHFNISVIGIRNGWEGMINNDYTLLNWRNVEGWSSKGGSMLGTRRQIPTELDKIAQAMNDLKIDGLAIVGGFDAYLSTLVLSQNRPDYQAFNVPMVLIPATISNNCPGTCTSLGSDTALNEICRQVDHLRQGAIGSANKVMIIETGGTRCGYLTSMAALATGADVALIHQVKHNEEDIHRMAREAKKKLATGKHEQFIVIRSEGANDDLPSKKVRAIFDSELKGKFSCRVTTLGYGQLGGHPTCFDRQMGIRMGIRAFEGIVNPARMGKRDCCVIGLRGNKLKYVPVSGLRKKICPVHRIPLQLWWLDIHPLVEKLSWKPLDRNVDDVVKVKPE